MHWLILWSLFAQEPPAPVVQTTPEQLGRLRLQISQPSPSPVSVPGDSLASRRGFFDHNVILRLEDDFTVLSEASVLGRGARCRVELCQPDPALRLPAHFLVAPAFIRKYGAYIDLKRVLPDSKGLYHHPGELVVPDDHLLIAVDDHDLPLGAFAP